MWLNERDLDIRCVQLKPYQLGDQLLLNVEQVIPLREASEYQVQVREKARRERAAAASSADWTRYDLTLDGKTSERLYKRRLIFAAVRYVIEQAGATPEAVASIVRHSRAWASADGILDAAAFQAAVTTQGLEARRFFSDDAELIRSNGRTYAFTKNWGTNTLQRWRTSERRSRRYGYRMPQVGMPNRPSTRFEYGPRRRRLFAG